MIRRAHYTSSKDLETTREATCQGFLDQAKVKAEKATAYIEKASAFWQELKNTATVSDVPDDPSLEEGLIATGGLSGNIDLARQWLEEVAPKANRNILISKKP